VERTLLVALDPGLETRLAASLGAAEGGKTAGGGSAPRRP